MRPPLAPQDIDRIIEMAWEDRTPFEAIELQFGFPEKEVIALLRKHLKARSFRLWRRRTNGRATKHQALSRLKRGRFKSTRQKAIAGNKVSKR
ncbi:MAG: TIGR03643 family protein [Cyclobacteriaceae bacterium]|nr:TIGR03643 family protein [Cyclobacteriaceae bacterium]